MRNRLIVVAKLAISVSVIFTLGKRLDFDQILLSLHQADIFLFLVSTGLAILAVPVVGERWRLLAEMFLFKISIAVATRATFTGLFIGQVLPGGIGADVVRGWMVWNSGLRNQLVIASLVADRIVSLCAVVLMIMISAPLLIPLLPQKIVYSIQLILVAITIVAFIVFFTFRKLRLDKFRKVFRWLIHKMSIEGVKLSNRIIFYALILAILGHTLMILSAYFLSLAIGINSSFWMWLVIMPIVVLVTAIPISINGWGIREYMMIHLWGLFGLIESKSFLISICVGLVAILSSLPGLWFWFKKKQYILVD